jgi:hypothetical protein
MFFSYHRWSFVSVIPGVNICARGDVGYQEISWFREGKTPVPDTAIVFSPSQWPTVAKSILLEDFMQNCVARTGSRRDVSFPAQEK